MFDLEKWGDKLHAHADRRLPSASSTTPERVSSRDVLDTDGTPVPLTPEAMGDAVYLSVVENIDSAGWGASTLAAMPVTDRAVAELAVKPLDGRLLYSEDEGWFKFDGKVFEPVSEAHVRTFADAINSAVVKAVQEADVSAAEIGVDGKTLARRRSDNEKLNNTSREAAVAKKLATLTGIEDQEAFTSNRYLVFNNGVLDTVETQEKGEIVFHPEHSQQYAAASRCRVNADYIPGSSPSVDMETFLQYSFESKLDGINCFRGLAAALFYPGNKLKLVMDLHGKPDSGKSMILRLMSHATGLYKTASRDHFAASSKNTFALVSLRGAKLIFAPEMDRKIDQDRVKQWSGGDFIETDVKSKDRIEFAPQGVLVFQSNSDDGTGFDLATDQGMALRYFPVHFPHTFTKDGMTPDGINPHYKKDLDIETRLLSPDQMSANISWMLESLYLPWCRLRTDQVDLTPNQEILRSRKSGDDDIATRVLAYLVEENVISPRDEVSKQSDWLAYSKFQAHYVYYCRARNIEPLTDRRLAKVLKERGLVQRTGNQNRMVGYVQGGSWADRIAFTDDGSLTEGM